MSLILISYKCHICQHEWYEEGEGTPYKFSVCPKCKAKHVLVHKVTKAVH